MRCCGHMGQNGFLHSHASEVSRLIFYQAAGTSTLAPLNALNALCCVHRQSHTNGDTWTLSASITLSVRPGKQAFLQVLL